MNLNRSFGRGSDQPEVRAVESWLAGHGLWFRVTFDLHEIPPYYTGEGFVESDNPTGTFLYETVTDGSPRIGRELIDSLADGTEVCNRPTIYRDINDRGVVAYPQACRNAIFAEETSLNAFLNGRYTGHSLTTETPTSWPFEDRVRTHLSFLRTALRMITQQRTALRTSSVVRQ